MGTGVTKSDQPSAAIRSAVGSQMFRIIPRILVFQLMNQVLSVIRSCGYPVEAPLATQRIGCTAQVIASIAEPQQSRSLSCLPIGWCAQRAKE